MTANGDEIKPGMHLVTDDGDKMFVFSLPSLYIVADQGSWEDKSGLCGGVYPHPARVSSTRWTSCCSSTGKSKSK